MDDIPGCPAQTRPDLRAPGGSVLLRAGDVIGAQRSSVQAPVAFTQSTCLWRVPWEALWSSRKSRVSGSGRSSSLSHPLLQTDRQTELVYRVPSLSPALRRIQKTRIKGASGLQHFSWQVSMPQDALQVSSLTFSKLRPLTPTKKVKREAQAKFTHSATCCQAASGNPSSVL
ncbi:hypothetical protein AAFF_G00061630 [Aldrovandia affinis]|uniref:Uncharacterized protein n=1 Tax=Aldrovandia affinis TaxID=143900 RepID=A0AAD7S2C1_9TELE|nr:hypothetical protein AAFF_G00061630 [Aldrovandia affinis]